MSTENEPKGTVLSFSQDLEFYLRAGSKALDKEDYITALSYLRLAYTMDRDDVDACTYLSELLNRMGLYELSARLLLLDITMNAPDPECLYGLACDFLAMNEFSYAAEFFRGYLMLCSDGEYAGDCEDFLAMLEDDEELRSYCSIAPEEDRDAFAMHRTICNAMQGGDLSFAAATLKDFIAAHPGSPIGQYDYLLLLYTAGQKAQAAALAKEYLLKHPGHILTVCLLAMIQSETGRKEEAENTLRSVPASPDKLDSMELYAASGTMLLLGQYERALPYIEALLLDTPYDRDTLHAAGYAYHMLGRDGEAAKQYRLLMQLDPEDTVASYYLSRTNAVPAEVSLPNKAEDTPVCEACENSDAVPKGKDVSWCLSYEVPLLELLRRKKELSRFFASGEKPAKLWKTYPEMHGLIVWGLNLAIEPDFQQSLTFLSSVKSRDTEWILRMYLLDPSKPDSRKHSVMHALRQAGYSEPYAVYLQGKWAHGTVQDNPVHLNRSCLRIFGRLRDRFDHCSEEQADAIVPIIMESLTELAREHPLLTRSQETALTAALEIQCLRRMEQEYDREEVISRYGISERRLKNAEKLIAPIEED